MKPTCGSCYYWNTDSLPKFPKWYWLCLIGYFRKKACKNWKPEGEQWEWVSDCCGAMMIVSHPGESPICAKCGKDCEPVKQSEQEKCPECKGEGKILKKAEASQYGVIKVFQRCPTCKGTGLKSKVEGVERILRNFVLDCITNSKRNHDDNIKKEEVLGKLMKVVMPKLHQSIERETIEKVEKICEELLGQDEKYKTIVAQGNIYIFSYNHAICDVKQKLKEIK